MSASSVCCIRAVTGSSFRQTFAKSTRPAKRSVSIRMLCVNPWGLSFASPIRVSEYVSSRFTVPTPSIGSDDGKSIFTTAWEKGKRKPVRSDEMTWVDFSAAYLIPWTMSIGAKNEIHLWLSGSRGWCVEAEARWGMFLVWNLVPWDVRIWGEVKGVDLDVTEQSEVMWRSHCFTTMRRRRSR